MWFIQDAAEAASLDRRSDECHFLGYFLGDLITPGYTAGKSPVLIHPIADAIALGLGPSAHNELCREAGGIGHSRSTS